MRGFFGKVVILGSLIVGIVACRIRITPLSPPAEPVCQPPPIEQNIIGSWQTGYRQSIVGDTIPKSAPFTTSIYARFGSLTFDRNKQIVDPDSLFENYIDGRGVVKRKVFSLETDTIKNSVYSKYGEMFWVRQYVKNNSFAQGYYFKVIANECSRIHLKGPAGAMELVLVRK